MAYRQVGTTTAFQNAVKLQEQRNDFEGAIATCLMDASNTLLPKALQIALNLPTVPTNQYHTISYLALKTSKYYIKIGKPGHALETTKLINLEERLFFYKQEGWINEVVELLQANRKLKELYRYLKGNSRFEDGANIAKKFDDHDNYICFVLMGIRAKLLNPVSYTEKAKLLDTKVLSDLLICTTTKFLEVKSVLAIIRGDEDECFKLHEKLSGYGKAEVFNAYINALHNNPEKVQVLSVLKNLRHILKVYNLKYPSKDIIEHFDIKTKNEGEFCVPPLVLEILHSSKPKYKKDIDGMGVLNELKLKSLFAKGVKSLAKNWLVMLERIFEEEIKTCPFFLHSGLKSFWTFLSKRTLHIEYRFYCEQFGIMFDSADDVTFCSAVELLFNLLNFEWTRYIPVNHPELQDFVQSITKSWMVVSKVFKQTLLSENAKHFIEKSVFQGCTECFPIMKFSKFASDTIETYASLLLDKKLNSDEIVSEIEIVAMGLLGIAFRLKDHQEIINILPQSYQIVSDLFIEINSFDLLCIPTNCEENANVWSILRSLITILLGKKHNSDGLLVRSLKVAIQHSEKNNLKSYGFERYFVLTLTLFGNLNQYLDSNTTKIFKSVFNELANVAVGNYTDIASLLKNVGSVSESADAFKVIHEIQAKYFREMVTYDFENRTFKLVQLEDFTPSKTHCYKIHLRRITAEKKRSQETKKVHMQSTESTKATENDVLKNHKPVASRNDKPVALIVSQNDKPVASVVSKSDKPVASVVSQNDKPVGLKSKTEIVEISKMQESLTITQKPKRKIKDKERLNFMFKSEHKLSTEEKKCLDPFQEVIKAVKVQWEKNDIL